MNMHAIFIGIAAIALHLKSADGQRGRYAETDRRTLHKESDRSDLCSSIIAVARSPEHDYLLENDIDINNYETNEEFVCELKDGSTIPIQGTDRQMRQLRSLLAKGVLTSSKSSIEVSSNGVQDGTLYLSPGKIVIKEGRKKNSNRKLSVYEGDKPVLVVRVTDKDGKVTSDNARTVSDKLFGSYGDQTTLKSQFAACSFGKLQVSNEYDVDISKHLAAPGVINVDLPISLSNSDRLAVRNAAIKAVEDKLGLGLPGPFQHVMFILEACYTDCGWAAYSFVGGYISVYQGNSYQNVGIVMHEVGHNLNLGHSGGLDLLPYSDHTCLMGNPLLGDDVGSMCFNPAKSFQIANGGGGWYNEQPSDTKVWNSGTRGGTQWSGSIIGVADYNNNPSFDPIVVKLETGTPDDLFVGFNRAKGINRDNHKYSDEVTVVEAGNDGIGYSQSFLKATLKEGESYMIPNWRGSGETLVIHVAEINMSANPAYASIVVKFGVARSDSPTGMPTQIPSLGPISCGDGFCEPGETALSCAYDCVNREFISTFDYNSKSNGNMFMIRAVQGIKVTSLSINTNSKGDGSVKVYTRSGSYLGHENDEVAWDLVFSSDTVRQIGRGGVTPLGRFASGVIIPAASYQSFYVIASGGLVCTRGRDTSKELKSYVSDQFIELYEGSGVLHEFGATTAPRVWNGIIKYNVLGRGKIVATETQSKSNYMLSYAPTFPPEPSQSCGDSVCDMNENSKICPVDCAAKEIETTFEYNLGSNGNIFAIKLKRDITVSSLAINSKSQGEGAVRIYTRTGSYTGHEKNIAGWDLVYYNPSVNHNRRGHATELGDFYSGVFVAKGSIQSFFVTSTKGLVYKEGVDEFAVCASDRWFDVLEGIGTDGEFEGKIFSPRIWGGKIRYDLH